MEGLRIRTTAGKEFVVHGKVTHKDFPEYGRIYYCAGWSWPAAIVEEVLSAGA